jgi:uncharacterized protein
MTGSTDTVRLTGNAYARPDYFLTDVAKGVTRTPAGQRIVSLPGDFLLGLRDAVLYECGKAYRPVLKAAGRRWGVQFAKKFDRELSAAYGAPSKDLPAGVVYTVLADAFAAHGYGRLTVRPASVSDDLTVVELADAVMPTLIPESDRPVDLLMAGMIGAVFAHLTGADRDAVQTDCPSLGSAVGRFVVGPPDRVADAEDFIQSADRMPAHDAVGRRMARIEATVTHTTTAHA